MTSAPNEKVYCWAVPPLSLLDHYAQRDVSHGVAFLPAGSMMVRLSDVLVTCTVPAVLSLSQVLCEFLWTLKLRTSSMLASCQQVACLRLASY